MERVRGDGLWSLFCPNEAPGLADYWGEEFEILYTQYEKEVTFIICLTASEFDICFGSDNQAIFFVDSGKGKKGYIF